MAQYYRLGQTAQAPSYDTRGITAGINAFTLANKGLIDQQRFEQEQYLKRAAEERAKEEIIARNQQMQDIVSNTQVDKLGAENDYADKMNSAYDAINTQYGSNAEGNAEYAAKIEALNKGFGNMLGHDADGTINQTTKVDQRYNDHQTIANTIREKLLATGEYSNQAATLAAEQEAQRRAPVTTAAQRKAQQGVLKDVYDKRMTLLGKTVGSNGSGVSIGEDGQLVVGNNAKTVTSSAYDAVAMGKFLKDTIGATKEATAYSGVRNLFTGKTQATQKDLNRFALTLNHAGLSEQQIEGVILSMVGDGSALGPDINPSTKYNLEDPKVINMAVKYGSGLLTKGKRITTKSNGMSASSARTSADALTEAYLRDSQAVQASGYSHSANDSKVNGAFALADALKNSKISKGKSVTGGGKSTSLFTGSTAFDKAMRSAKNDGALSKAINADPEGYKTYFDKATPAQQKKLNSIVPYSSTGKVDASMITPPETTSSGKPTQKSLDKFMKDAAKVIETGNPSVTLPKLPDGTVDSLLEFAKTHWKDTQSVGPATLMRVINSLRN